MVAIIIPGRYGPRIAGGTASASTVPIALVAPNDFSNADWSPNNMSRVGGQPTDPLGGSNSSIITSTGSGFGQVSAPTNYSGGAAGVLIGGQIYSITGSIKANTAPDWMQVMIYDVGSGADFGYWINASTGAFGTDATGGAATLDGHTITPLGSGWHQFVLTGHFTATTAGAIVVLTCASADGNQSASVGQAFQVYGWGA